MARWVFPLVLNEFTLWAQRMKPWWRDDDDAARDELLKEYQRVGIFALAIFYIEVGQFLSRVQLAPLGLRLGLYLLFGAWLFWRRRAFWVNPSRLGAGK